MNMKLIADQLSNWFGSAGRNAWIFEILAIPILVVLGVILLYITFHPWLRDRISFIRLQRPVGVHQEVVISTRHRLQSLILINVWQSLSIFPGTRKGCSPRVFASSTKAKLR